MTEEQIMVNPVQPKEVFDKKELKVVHRLNTLRYIKTDNIRFSSDYYNKLNEEIKRIVDKSITNAKLNGRKTLMPQDI